MKNNTPKLRFPEFKNSGEWEEVKLGEVCKILVGGDLPEIFSKIKTEKYNIPIYSNGTNEKMLYGYTDKAKITEECVTVSARGTIGYTCYHNKPFYPIVRLLCLIPNNNINTLYLKYNLDTVKFYGTSVAISQLTSPMIKEYKIILPLKEEEQTKIANCFSSLDKLIGLEKEKLNKLQEHKKGLMSNLFPNNNEKQPKIRFPEFKDSGDWKEVFIKDTFIHYGGTSLEKYVVNNGTHKFISIGNYSTDGKYIDNGNRINLNEITSKKMLEKDNLVMILNDKTMDGKIIGACILIEEDNKYIYNQRSERLVCNEFILPLFAWYILNSSLIRNKIRNKSQGATQIYINYTSIESIKLYIPTSIKEQTKIANCLFLLDVEIDNQKLKIEKLEEHKKGLLQSLFI